MSYWSSCSGAYPGPGTRTEARTIVTATATDFIVLATLEAYEGETRVFARSWDATIPRVDV